MFQAQADLWRELQDNPPDLTASALAMLWLILSLTFYGRESRRYGMVDQRKLFVGDLARALGMARSTAEHALQDLERAKFIERELREDTETWQRMPSEIRYLCTNADRVKRGTMEPPPDNDDSGEDDDASEGETGEGINRGVPSQNGGVPSPDREGSIVSDGFYNINEHNDHRRTVAGGDGLLQGQAGQGQRQGPGSRAGVGPDLDEEADLDRVLDQEENALDEDVRLVKRSSPLKVSWTRMRS